MSQVNHEVFNYKKCLVFYKDHKQVQVTKTIVILNYFFKICCIYSQAAQSVGCEADLEINEMITGLCITVELVLILSSLLDCFLLNSTDQKIIYVLFIFYICWVEILVCCYISVIIITQGCLLVSLCLETLKCLLFLSECNGFFHTSICCRLFCSQKGCTC